MHGGCDIASEEPGVEIGLDSASAVEESAVSSRDGPWFSAPNLDRRQTYVDRVAVAVDE